MKLEELRFGLDYSISDDMLNSPGNPPWLRGQGSLSLHLQYHTRRKNRAGCFVQVTKINAVLLLGAMLEYSSCFREMDFAQQESARGKIQEEGGEVMLQASFLTSRAGLKLHHKVEKYPKPAKHFLFFLSQSNIHQTGSGISPGIDFWLSGFSWCPNLPLVPLPASRVLRHLCLPLQSPSQRLADTWADFV